MRYIAHRGLCYGPDEMFENHPTTVLRNMELHNCDAEVDVWWIDEEWYLGHDKPTYKVDSDFFLNKGLWLHCKNHSALVVAAQCPHLNAFWHESDAYALTSHGFAWAYPGKELGYRTVCVMPEWNGLLDGPKPFCYAVCTDYVAKAKALWGK